MLRILRWRLRLPGYDRGRRRFPCIRHGIPGRFAFFLQLDLARSGGVLALHRTEAANGQQAQRIGGLPAAEGKQLGAHTHRKLIDLDPQELGGDEMAPLMDGDEQPEEQDANDDIEQNNTSFFPCLQLPAGFLRRRAGSPVRRIHGLQGQGRSGHGVQGVLHHAGDVQKSDLPRQEAGHGDLIGSV